MRYWLGLVANALLLAMPMAASPQTDAGPPPAPLPPETAARIDGAFDGFQQSTPVPGMVYGIVRGGGLAYVRAEGVQRLNSPRPVDERTRFRIASMSKAFTALAILKLRDDGKLRLDDLAETHVPEMRGWTYPTTDSPRIRIRDLLAHVAGFVTDDPWGDRQQVLSEPEFTRMIAAGVPWSRPGQQAHEYSNFGYALLGRIVSNVSGEPYQTYIRRTILMPLGMAETGYEVGDVPADRLAVGYRWENDQWVEEPAMRDGAFGAMGGLHTTATDYAKWLGFLLSAWPERDGTDRGPVKRSTVREMAQGLNFVRVSPRPGQGADDKCVHAFAYGMGMRVTPDCELGLTLSHGGGYPGYGSFVVLAPERGVAAFAFTNRTYQAPSLPVWQSLYTLARADQIYWNPKPDTPELRGFHDLARQAYAMGSLAPLRDKLAMNFLLDRSEANWRLEFGRLQRMLGRCTSAEPLMPQSMMQASFRWNCERGLLDGQILLAPTRPLTVQALRFNPQPRAISQP